MNEMKLVSVIIPVYNMEKYVARCLDSVCNNTYKNLEIICINDGSRDGSLGILREYEKQDSRIIVIDQENKKVSAARNAGMNIAKGEWIAFLDPDDWVHCQYFEILMSYANKTDADIVICDTYVSSEETVEDEIIDFNDISYQMITKAQLNKLHLSRSRVWGKLYKKSIIDTLRFVSGAEPVEDNAFNTTLYSSKMKYCLVDVKMYYYFMRDDSAVHQNTGRQSLVYTKCMLPVIDKETDPEKRQDMVKRCYNILFSSRYTEMYSKDYKDLRRVIRSELAKVRKYHKYLTPKEQLIYHILSISPGIYRAWRIHDDPTLLEYEKTLKKRALEESDNQLK